MTGNAGAPHDLVSVWGDDPTFLVLVRAWGPGVFRDSKLHQLALIEQQRQQDLEPHRKDYLKKKQA